jgi:hypothetical protein
LSEQFDVRRFAATRARAGKLEQRFERLHAAHVVGRNRAPIQFGDVEEVIPVLHLGVAQRRLRTHVDRLEFRLGFVARRTDVHAHAATRAIFDRDLNRELLPLPLGQPRGSRLEGLGRVIVRTVKHLAANRRMRTDEDALAALDTNIRIPDGNFGGEIALLPFRRRRRERAIARHRADGQAIAATRLAIGPSTLRTNAGACAGTGGRITTPVSTEAGTLTSTRFASVVSTAAMFIFTISSPFLP